MPKESFTIPFVSFHDLLYQLNSLSFRLWFFFSVGQSLQPENLKLIHHKIGPKEHFIFIEKL